MKMLPVYEGSVKDLVSQKYTHGRVLKYASFKNIKFQRSQRDSYQTDSSET